ncbi:SGNH hydrolase [Trichodelitschia bisporula]|uniref:SGNH hydrolase n=1 Tax=Trichodelitschia bisporula TaxID=703511 RepID=A0A6G1HJ34_9PEZI|nr:SGNH hydrolase [Trichodelitschia bisporula]
MPRLSHHLAWLALVIPPAASANPAWITSLASLGDSYAAGLGVGTRTHYSCSRYTGAYPYLLAARLASAGTANLTQTHHACSGLTSVQIHAQQVPHLPSSLDIILLSAGGNDAALGPVLDACIFQWRHGGTAECEAALNNSAAHIAADLPGNMDALLTALLPKLSERGRIFLPGYAAFFGEGPECDDVSWCVWPRIPASQRQNLTRARRVRMNALVHLVNVELAAAAARAGPRVRFVPWGWAVGDVAGRFCSSGVVEPAPERAETLFWEWDTAGDGDEWRVERPGDPVPKDSFEGQLGGWVAEGAGVAVARGEGEGKGDRGLRFGPVGGREVWLTAEVLGVMEGNRVGVRMGLDDFVFWFLPDSWKRVFHPRALAQRLIAEMVWKEMEGAWGEGGVAAPKVEL